MDKRIKIFLIVAASIMVGVILYDMLSTHIANRPDNPYEYNVDEFKSAEGYHISYKEARQISIGTDEPIALAWSNGNLYLLSATNLRIINTSGHELLNIQVSPQPASVAVSDEKSFLICFGNYIIAYDSTGKETYRSQPLSDKSLFTAMTIMEDKVFIADAGQKMVQVYNLQLEHTGGFKGESGVSSVHGFIIPSNRFDLAVNKDSELWVVNPGMHIIQNYTPEGRLRGFWGTPSFAAEGFSGCCNPSYIAFLSDGRFVTSEKGIIRVKIYKESGQFESLVAPAENFEKGERAPAVAVDDQDNIWLLDFDKRSLRLFMPVKEPMASN